MYSIMDAVEAAQRRTEERDAMNRQRLPVVPVTNQPMQPIIPVSQGGGGGGPGREDTRTQHEKYLDAIDANRYVGAIPVVGPIIGAINDSFIENYEAQNPDKVTGGGQKKFSTLGRAQGKGLTVEEQLEMEKAGLGLGKMLGFGDQKPGGGPQPGYTLFDRIFNTTPMNIPAESDYIGSFPQGGDGPSEGGPIGGYEQEDLSFDSFSGPVGYA